jgi:Leucine-rich repeat (LRR) protein
MRTISYFTILTILFSCHHDIYKEDIDSDFYKIDGERLKIYEYNTTLESHQKIKALSFEGQMLSELPIELLEYTHLEFLNLRSNKLNALPTFITKLVNLKVLLIDNNPVDNLPDSFARLTTLKILTINETNISKLPDGFESMNLELLLVGSAPLDEDIRSKLRQRMTNCKIIESVD